MASEFPNLKKALEDYIEDVKTHYQDLLTKDNKKATGKLINSVRANVKIGATQYIAELRLQDYWKYIEYGTKESLGHAIGKEYRASIVVCDENLSLSILDKIQ